MDLKNKAARNIEAITGSLFFGAEIKCFIFPHSHLLSVFAIPNLPLKYGIFPGALPF